MPLVRIKKGATHRNVSGTLLYSGEVVEVSEAEMVAFGDKFEVAEPQTEPVPEISATKAAQEYAEEHSISLSLSNIQGTGRGGRITLSDVKEAVGGNT